MKNTRPCPCCGTVVPYPTESGIWKFKDIANSWITVEVRPDSEGGLGLFYHGKSKEGFISDSRHNWALDHDTDEPFDECDLDFQLWWPDPTIWEEIKK